MQIISFSIFALLFSAVSAFSLSARQQGVPNCALTCLATTPTAPCSATNNTCLCHDETFLKAQLACVKQSCTSASDFAAAQQFAITLCQQVGVDLSTDTNLVPASTSAASGGGGSGSASTSASGASATSPAPSATQTSGALSLDIRAAGALLLTVAAIALTL